MSLFPTWYTQQLTCSLYRLSLSLAALHRYCCTLSWTRALERSLAQTYIRNICHHILLRHYTRRTVSVFTCFEGVPWILHERLRQILVLSSGFHRTPSTFFRLPTVPKHILFGNRSDNVYKANIHVPFCSWKCTEWTHKSVIQGKNRNKEVK